MSEAPQRARVTDVARAAGVSTATVDRVLNRRPGVRDATVQRVLKAAAKLDYLPDTGPFAALASKPLRLAFLLPAGTNRYLRMLGETVGFMEDQLAPFNVQVVSIEPGDFATGITAARQLAVPVERSAYPAFARTLAIINRDETSAAPANEVAERIARVLDQRSPPPSILVGQFIQRYAVLLRAVLPARLFDWALTKLYSL